MDRPYTESDTLYLVGSMTKQQVCDAFREFINQRPGISPNGYFEPGYADVWSVRAYNSDRSLVCRQRQKALTLLAQLENQYHNYHPRFMARALHRGLGGRLVMLHTYKLEYTAGQCYPTEYRAAAVEVLELYFKLAYAK